MNPEGKKKLKIMPGSKTGSERERRGSQEDFQDSRERHFSNNTAQQGQNCSMLYL